MLRIHRLLAFGGILLMASASADASLISGTLLGVQSGNDSVAALLSAFGISTIELGKLEIDEEGLSDGTITIADDATLSVNEDDEPISGQWSFTGVGTVQYLVIKAGPNYALYDFTAATDPYNAGLWSTAALNNMGLSHLTVYGLSTPPGEDIPEPASVGLMAVGGLMILKRRAAGSRA